MSTTGKKKPLIVRVAIILLLAFLSGALLAKAVGLVKNSVQGQPAEYWVDVYTSPKIDIQFDLTTAKFVDGMITAWIKEDRKSTEGRQKTTLFKVTIDCLDESVTVHQQFQLSQVDEHLVDLAPAVATRMLCPVNTAGLI